MCNKTVIGKCSNCGGNVSVPTVWYSVVPPVPTCEKCGATPTDTLPIIQMQPPQWIPVKENPVWTGGKDDLRGKLHF